VTADSGMTELCRARGLVPDGCSLFGTREVGAPANRLREELGQV
jgi:hypothetical protein